MNYADIKQYDVANGLGIRVSLFVSGCTHACKGCFNEVAWDFNYGSEFTEKNIDDIMTYLEPEYVSGLTLLGGEPFEYSNQEGILPLLRRFREKYPMEDYDVHGKNIWAYSGYLFDRDIVGTMCKESDMTREIISYIDILVDGEFHEDEKNLKLHFKGSENQRTILVQESLEKGAIVLWTPPAG
ncbi:MAG: anaerobic ribonucleoside-triphosphate reductase activating protein [Lachnospiraceae bacterium]|nr:anaerobic ribonucleoside-triphosphate reductase activating protein [Lachnospiraceae bacterium]